MSLSDLIELFINLTPIHAPVYFLINNPSSQKDQFYTEKKSKTRKATPAWIRLPTKQT